MKMRNGVLLAAIVGGLAVGPGVSMAEQPVEPTETGEVGLLTIPTTQTLGAGKIELGTYYRNDIDNNEHFENDLAQLRDTSVQQFSFIAGVGVWDGIDLTVQVPYIAFDNTIQKPGENSSEDEVARKFGDVRIGPKFRLFQEGNSPVPFSLAIAGSAQLPTGSKQLPAQLDRNTAYNGDKVCGDVMGIIDKDLFKLPGDAPVTLTLNIGGLFPSKPDVFRLDRQTEPVFSQLRRKGFPNVEVKDAVVEYGAGLKVPLWVNHIGTLDSTAEYRGNTGTIDEVDDYQAVLAGLRYTLVNGWAAQGGVDFGLSNSVNRYNALAGITYTGPQPPPSFPEAGKEKVVYRDRIIQVEKVSFSDVTFEFDKATLTDVGRGRVYLIAQKLKEGKNVKIEIQGHTDYIGTEDYNKKLGTQRAETVKAELVRLGIDPSRISTVSFGEDKPLIDMQTPWARAVNRRAEFVVVSEPTATSSGKPAEETEPVAPMRRR
jgi:outer membrane protein OmpA-like peptidoglycan-associated protein